MAVRYTFEPVGLKGERRKYLVRKPDGTHIGTFVPMVGRQGWNLTDLGHNYVRFHGSIVWASVIGRFQEVIEVCDERGLLPTLEQLEQRKRDAERAALAARMAPYVLEKQEALRAAHAALLALNADTSYQMPLDLRIQIATALALGE